MSTQVIEEILPIELFEQIIAFLSKSDLASLSRVNRKFNLASQSTLYYSVSITNLRAGIICLRSIYGRQELALAVRQFTLRPDAEDYVDLLSLQGLLGRSIKAMSNLVELRIPVPPRRYDEGWSLLTVFDNPPCMIDYASHHLTICDFSGLPHYEVCGEWFVVRPHIVELHIGKLFGIDKIHPSVLQRVISPAADKAALLIPGRPVTLLCIHLDAVYSFKSFNPLPIFESDVLPLLNKGSVPLKVFECKCDRFGFDDFFHLFNSLSLHLPILETMRIKIKTTLIDISGVFQAIEVALGSTIAKFKDLSVFVLTWNVRNTTAGGRSALVDDSTTQYMVDSLFSRSATLQTIETLHQSFIRPGSSSLDAAISRVSPYHRM